MSRLVRLTQLGLCAPCGKFAYRSRQDAKNAMRTLHPGDHRMGAYRCGGGTGTWHFGHSHRKTPGWAA